MATNSNSSTALKTLQLYFHENMRFKGLFITTNVTWTVGMILQKLILPLIIAQTFDQIISIENTDDLHWGLFTNRLIFFVVVVILAQICIDVGLVLLSKLQTKVIERLHMRIYSHLLEQSADFHNNSFGGALVNKANRLVSGYVSLTDTFVLNASQLLVLSVFSCIVLAFYSPLLASLIFVWSMIFFYVNLRLTRKRVRFSKARAAADSVLTASLADSMSNVSAIKTFSAENYEAKRHRKLAYDRAQKGYRYWIISVKNDAVFGLMMGLIQFLVLVASIFAVQQGQITVGTLVLAQAYTLQAIANLWGLSGTAKNIEQQLSDAAEMTEILEHKPEVEDVRNAPNLNPSQGKIAFNAVSFTHVDNNDALFHKLSFAIQPSEKIGLIGSSGGGKTTITRLLLRMMDIQDGAIEIDGQNIAEVTQESLRRAIAYVPQEPLLFHRSLAENIRYGKPDATDKEVERAAKLAHAHEFIKDLPKGYETLVGERGVKLSGGQRQRVAIARAILKDAPILVLDEATSALDSESEKLIQDALNKLMEGRTTIVIAHRLSTIQKMDRIIVLDKGAIVEEGSHADLLGQNGTYAKLWKHQSGGFLEE